MAYRVKYNNQNPVVGNQSSLSPGDLIYRVIYISTGLHTDMRMSVQTANTVIPVEIPVEWKYRWNGNTGGYWMEIPLE
jgi:hypothetical protein